MLDIERGDIAQSVEERLMLLCARLHSSDIDSRKIAAAIQEGVDWTRFTSLIEAHHVLPIVYSCLQQGGYQIPEPFANDLKRRYLVNIQHCFKLTRELAHIAESFSNDAIDILPFKGPFLAQSVYDNVALRQSGDLDILVRTADLEKASSILSQIGYATPLRIGDAGGDTIHVGHLVESDRTQHYEFYNPTGTVVELHKDIGLSYLRFGLKNQDLWKIAEPTQTFGHEMYKLPPIYDMLLLIHHGSKHGWYLLSWVCDIAEFVRTHSDLDWDQLFRVSRQFRMETMTKVAILLAVNSLGCSIPDRILQLIIRDRQAVQLCQRVQAMHRTILDSHSYDRYEFGFNCLVIDRFPDLIRYIFLRCTTPSFKEWNVIALPRKFAILYRVVRPARIVGELAGQFASKLTHRQ